jgi:hypothetical protein
MHCVQVYSERWQFQQIAHCRLHVSHSAADLKAGYFVRTIKMAEPDSITTIALAMGVEVQECPEGSYQPYEGENPVYNCTSCGEGLRTEGTGSTSSEACCE